MNVTQQHKTEALKLVGYAGEFSGSVVYGVAEFEDLNYGGKE